MSMKSLIATLLITLPALTGTAGAAAAQATTSDSALHPLTTRDSSRGWQAVGRLNLGTQAFCTATLIAPDRVLTAAHCLFDRATGAPLDTGSITFLAEAGRDAYCAALACTMEAGQLGAAGRTRKRTVLPEGGAQHGEIALAVCGAHMSGLPLNHQLTALGGRFLRACRTAPAYSLHALAGGPPQRPGLVRRPGNGASIELEIWGLPTEGIGAFLAGIPAPLGIGTVELEDGSSVKGFLCETHGLAGARDITAFGGWRKWLARGEPSIGEEAVA